MRIEHCTSHPGTRLVALACAVAFAAVAPAAEPPGAETDAGPEQRARVLEEQAAELAIRILRAQAHLADLEEALGGPASVPPRVGIPDLRDGMSVEQALAGLEHEAKADHGVVIGPPLCPAGRPATGKLEMTFRTAAVQHAA